MTDTHDTKFCSCCKTHKAKSFFGKRQASKDGLMSYCRDCMSAYDKARDKTDKRKILHKSKKSKQPEYRKEKYLNAEYRKKCNDACKKYYIKNRDKIIKEKVRQSRKNDKSIFVHNVRARIRGVFRNSPYTKKSRVFEILGCSYEFLMDYIESKFQPGMTWERSSEIHIDHIIPLASAKTEEDVIRLNHYTNLQPLWAKDNLSKGSKLDHQLCA